MIKKTALLLVLFVSIVTRTWATEVSVLGSLGTNQYYSIGTGTTFTTSYSNSDWFLLGFTSGSETYYVYWNGNKTGLTSNANAGSWSVIEASKLSLTSDNYWRYAFNIQGKRLAICLGDAIDSSSSFDSDGLYVYITSSDVEAYYQNGGTLASTTGYLKHSNKSYYVAASSSGLSETGSQNSATQFTIYPLTKITRTTSTLSISDMTVGQGDAITPSITTNNTDSYTVTYSSSNSGVVSASGSTLTTVGAGEATITASMAETANFTAATTTFKITVKASNKRVVYAKENNPYPYRIPALAQNKDEKLIAIADNRPSSVDIGSGEVDLVARLKADGTGSDWGDANIFANGDGGTDTGAYGYGDAAVVADRESNNVLVMSCYAEKGNNFWSGAMASARILSADGGSTWGTPTIISASNKASLIGVTGAGAFFTSGRILQSQYTKVGSYYRIYSTLCATQTSTTTSSPNYKTSTWVVYSDDFGATWNVLGGTSAAPVVNGNEAKVEELPDGRIVVSSRVNDNAGASTGNAGRYFNIFTYTDTENADGTWGTAVKNTTISANDANGTNGEILIVPAKDASNNDVYIALQSAPAGGSVSGTATSRSHVSVYYKVLDAYANFNDPTTFAADWTLGKELSSTTSAYSTMILQQDGNIGVLYEDNSYNGGYDIVYNKFALSELASGYTLNTSIDRKTFVKNYFNAYEATQTSWSDDVKAEFEGLVAALSDGITTAELDAIYSFAANPVVNYDGKVVTLKCVGNTESSKNSEASSSSTFTEYVYNNSNVIGVTTTAPTKETGRNYEFKMIAGENGGYTFQSVSNNSYYIGLDSNDKMCLVSGETNAQEFDLVKNGNYSTGYTSVDMDGYALHYARKNTSGTDDVFAALSNTQLVDRINYTVQSFGSSPYYSTDFTIDVKYAVTSDEKNVTVKGTMTDGDIQGALNYLESKGTKTANSLVYVEDNTYSTTTNNVVVKGNDDTYTCKNLVLADKVDVSIPTAFTATSATYSRDMGTTSKWGTICLPFAPKASDVTFYTLQKESDKTDGTGTLTFTAVENPEANVPYVFRTDLTEITISNTNCSVAATVSVDLSNASAGWTLKGTYSRIAVNESGTATATNIVDPNTYYIKSNKFYKINELFNLSAFRAYFSAATTLAKASVFSLEEAEAEVDAINTLMNPENEVVGYFNADGMKMNDIQKGLNIIKYKSGKIVKIMIK